MIYSSIEKQNVNLSIVANEFLHVNVNNIPKSYVQWLTINILKDKVHSCMDENYRSYINRALIMGNFHLINSGGCEDILSLFF